MGILQYLVAKQLRKTDDTIEEILSYHEQTLSDEQLGNVVLQLSANAAVIHGKQTIFAYSYRDKEVLIVKLYNTADEPENRQTVYQLERATGKKNWTLTRFNENDEPRQVKISDEYQRGFNLNAEYLYSEVETAYGIEYID